MCDAERFWAKVDKTEGCWNWTAGLNTRGYGTFKLYGKTVSSHRLSYVIHHPLSIDLWEHREICVCHRCDNPKCVNPAHLFLGSIVDNNNDRDIKGRGFHPKGEQHGRAILTETQVREIRGRYSAGGITQLKLGVEYGISRSVIRNIINYKAWKHLE